MPKIRYSRLSCILLLTTNEWINKLVNKKKFYLSIISVLTSYLFSLISASSALGSASVSGFWTWITRPDRDHIKLISGAPVARHTTLPIWPLSLADLASAGLLSIFGLSEIKEKNLSNYWIHKCIFWFNVKKGEWINFF